MEKKQNLKPIIMVIALLAIVLLTFGIYLLNNITKISTVDSSQILASTGEDAKQGNVIVKYVDTEGNQIEQSSVLVGNVGDEYITERKEISSYQAYGNDPMNKIGNYDTQDIEVEYVYQKENNGINVTDGENVITVSILKSKQKDPMEVKFSIVTVSEDGNTLYEAKYKVEDANLSTIKEAISYGESLIVGSLTIDETGTETYYITEESAPTGYGPISDTIELNIIKTYNQQTGTYEITLGDTNYENVDIKYENGEIIVTIINAKAEETEEPNDPETPEGTEDKIFDLQIDKYLTEVVVRNSSETITRSKDRDDEDIMKIEVSSKKVTETAIDATYAIEITNVGEIAGYATKIVDILPDGMEVIAGDGWTVLDGQAESNALADTIIEPGESKTIYITLSWDLSDGEVGLKTNKAVISEYYNEENIEDATPDNTAEEPLLASIKTGSVFAYAMYILMALMMMTLIVIMCKDLYNRNNKN